MSMHKIPLTPIEESGLRAHGLDIGKPSQLSDAFRQGVRYASAQLPSQGGEAVEVVASIAVDAEGVVRDFTLEPGLDRHPGGYTVTPLMTVAQHQRILAAATHPADQVAEPVLERPAKVGAGTFSAGLPQRMVVEAAYRQYEYAQDPPFSDEQIAAVAKTLGADHP